MKLGQGNIFRSVCQKFCSQGGLQAHTWGDVGGLAEGAASDPHPGEKLGGLTRGVSRPTPGGGLQTHTWGDVSQHALRQTLPPIKMTVLLHTIKQTRL